MNQPVPPDLLQQLETLTPDQLAWLSGYAWGRSRGGASAAATAPADVQAAAAPAAQGADQGVEITVFSASQTGNALAVAKEFHGKLVDQGFNAKLVSAGDFKSRNISQLSTVLFVISTQGEGDPPEEAIPLFKFLNGKKAPDLSSMKYAILALGDTSYTDSYCQAGRDLDKRLGELGAQTLADRVDCDLDYQAAAEQWQNDLIDRLQEFKGGSGAATGAAPAAGAAATAAAGASQYTKENPFEASILVRQKITSRDALKDVEHIEIDLEGSGLQYQPGDSVGIYYENAARLVDEILQHTQIDPDEKVEVADKQSVTVREALTKHLDITQNTPAMVKEYAQYSEHADLQELISDMNSLNDYVNNNPPVRVFADFAGSVTAQQLCDLFRPLTPRLYSIASSQEEVGEEVHITLGVVRFTNHDVVYTGGASGYLAETLEEGDSVRVFIEENKHFRLPTNESTNVIMIGAGTGVAPYRAFMQEREAKEHSGQNWLIFGNQNFLNDFLYQTEWLQYRDKGLLNRYDFAWSRDTDQKVYVQHKLKEQGADIWQWLQEGAHIYVCGDATRMAKDVELALQELIAEHGNMSLDDADEYLSALREDNRYQRDVY